MATQQSGSGAELTTKQRFQQFVVPNYGRFDLTLCRGSGCDVWDDQGRRYLDMGAGIAVCALGHAHPALSLALREQADKLIHVSNLYYHDLQGRFAEQLVQRIAPGKCFFCNSGAEANETLIKLARKVGHDSGRFEIISFENSFHGRTLAGISATGQPKVKAGFEPLLPGFVHVPFNDLEGVEAALSPSTIAVLVEGIQGEGGINVATPEFLLGLRRFCDENDLLLLFDGVQCGHFRTGRFQSYQRLLEGVEEGQRFQPDAIAMAKSLGGGFPMGAVWIEEKHSAVLGPGSHGSTFGGTPLASAMGLAVIEEVARKSLEANARTVGDRLKASLLALKEKYPDVITAVRGIGLMIGIVFRERFSTRLDGSRPLSLQLVVSLAEEGMLTIPAGADVVRFLPPLNLSATQADEAVARLEQTIRKLVV